jgi:hypothetical protein
MHAEREPHATAMCTRNLHGRRRGGPDSDEEPIRRFAPPRRAFAVCASVQTADPTKWWNERALKPGDRYVYWWSPWSCFGNRLDRVLTAESLNDVVTPRSQGCLRRRDRATGGAQLRAAELRVLTLCGQVAHRYTGHAVGRHELRTNYAVAKLPRVVIWGGAEQKAF